MAQRVRDAAPTIRAVRGHAAGIRDATTREALRLLESGRDAEAVIGYLAHTLTNKLLHAPSARLRKAGEEGDDVTLEAARNLFGIDDDQ
jgi:glutamyl-tRNA reductase